MPDRSRFAPLVIVLVLAASAALLPPQMLRPLNLVGYAVCHRITERSFIVNQQQLPVCARDTGMFTGALVSLIVYALVLRTRASQFPGLPHALVLGVFFGTWAFDGFNSYIMLITRQPLFYIPQNSLRLITGALMGVSLSAYVAALWNQALWQDATPERTVASWRDVLRLVLVAALVVAIVVWQPAFLYGPLALLSSLGVIVLLSIVNSLVVVIVAKRHGTLSRWSQLWPALVAGVVLTGAEIAGIALFRAAFTAGAGWPL